MINMSKVETKRRNLELFSEIKWSDDDHTGMQAKCYKEIDSPWGKYRPRSQCHRPSCTSARDGQRKDSACANQLSLARPSRSSCPQRRCWKNGLRKWWARRDCVVRPVRRSGCTRSQWARRILWRRTKPACHNLNLWWQMEWNWESKQQVIYKKVRRSGMVIYIYSLYIYIYI